MNLWETKTEVLWNIKPQVAIKTENVEKKSTQKNITIAKEKVQVKTGKPKKVKYTDEELDSLGVSGIVELLRKELTDNNSDNYGDCKGRLLKYVEIGHLGIM